MITCYLSVVVVVAAVVTVAVAVVTVAVAVVIVETVGAVVEGPIWRLGLINFPVAKAMLFPLNYVTVSDDDVAFVDEHHDDEKEEAFGEHQQVR